MDRHRRTQNKSSSRKEEETTPHQGPWCCTAALFFWTQDIFWNYSFFKFVKIHQSLVPYSFIWNHKLKKRTLMGRLILKLYCEIKLVELKLQGEPSCWIADGLKPNPTYLSSYCVVEHRHNSLCSLCLVQGGSNVTLRNVRIVRNVMSHHIWENSLLSLCLSYKCVSLCLNKGRVLTFSFVSFRLVTLASAFCALNLFARREDCWIVSPSAGLRSKRSAVKFAAGGDNRTVHESLLSLTFDPTGPLNPVWSCGPLVSLSDSFTRII